MDSPSPPPDPGATDNNIINPSQPTVPELYHSLNDEVDRNNGDMLSTLSSSYDGKIILPF